MLEKTPIGIEARGKIRKEVGESLTGVQSGIREGLKGGRKPEIPEGLTESIAEIVDEVVESQDNVLVSVIPEAHESTKEYLLHGLVSIAKELKRSGSLKDSFFDDRNRVALITELLIINKEGIASIISKNKTLSAGLLKKAERIATYHDSGFIKNFLDKDDIIAQTLGITQEEAKDNFPKGLRLHLAVNNISKPTDALKRVKENLDTKLTDENIAANLGITPQEARDNFPKGIRLHLAVHNISNPTEALKRVKENLDTKLTDENIAQTLDITQEEAKDNFPKGLRLRLAVHNISKPIEALERVKENLDIKLTDENIAQTLGITQDEARDNFPKGLRLHFASHNISKPIEALERVRENLDIKLTDKNIAQTLDITPEEAKDNFPKGLRLHLAVNNISKPTDALKRVKENLDTKLTDENIAQTLGITQEEAKDNFPKSIRLYFAVHNISNPIEGLIKWLDGSINTPFKKPDITLKKQSS
ncbi:MAG: hypothetical protein Q8P93_02635 [bacterium]|nr:hypothetical protein [bacterium]